MKWREPIKIGELLDRCFDDSVRPPISKGVYVVSVNAWKNQPEIDCEPLYLGSNTQNENRFRARIGDLLADMFGFFGVGENAGHHSGGQKLYSYARDKKLNPKELYIGWLYECKCSRCAENWLYEKLNSDGKMLNSKRPSKCAKHKSNLL